MPPPPTQSKQSSQSKSARAAQDFLNLSTVRDGVIVLKSGGLRAILMASSLNFALKSAEEQEAIVFQYQNFLNSLDFSVQFVIHSRRLNIAPYLESMRGQSREETNELLKIQIDEYIEFVKSFVDLSNIVSKTFYVTIPYDLAMFSVAATPEGVIEGITSGITSLLSGKSAQKKTSTETNEELEFQERKNQLQQRVDQVQLGLVRLGIRTAQLNTEEVIELLYGLYNQGEFGKKEENTFE